MAMVEAKPISLDAPVVSATLSTHEQVHRERVIATHKFPDMDAYTSVWLLKRFSLHNLWKNAQLEFVEMGKSTALLTDAEVSSKKSEPILMTTSGVEIAVTDTGYGYFDHHQKDRTSMDLCASALMWQYVREQNPAILENTRLVNAVEMVVDHVLDIDHLQQVYWDKLQPGEQYLPLYQVSDAFRQSTQLAALGEQRDQKIAEVGGLILDATVKALVLQGDNSRLSADAQKLVSMWYENVKASSGSSPEIEETYNFLVNMHGPENDSLKHSGLSLIHTLNGLALTSEGVKSDETVNLILQSVHEFRVQQVLPAEKLIQDAESVGHTIDTKLGRAILLQTRSQYVELQAYARGYKIALMQFPESNFGRIYFVPQDKRRPEGEAIDLAPVFVWLQENDPMQKELNQQVAQGIVGADPEDGWFLFKGTLPVADNAKRPSKREPQIIWENLLKQLPIILESASPDSHGLA